MTCASSGRSLRCLPTRRPPLRCAAEAVDSGLDLRVVLQAGLPAAGGGLSLDELEYHVRMLILTGRFAGTNGIPETMLMPSLPERFLAPPSPFRTIAELAASLFGKAALRTSRPEEDVAVGAALRARELGRVG